VSLAQLIAIVLQVSIGLVVFCLALRAERGDLTYLLRHPIAPRALPCLSMNVLMPLLAVAVAVLFKLRLEVEVALVLLALSPVPPVLPGKQGKAGGSASYAIGLAPDVRAAGRSSWCPCRSALDRPRPGAGSVRAHGRRREDGRTLGRRPTRSSVSSCAMVAPAFARRRAAGPLSKLGHDPRAARRFLPVLGLAVAGHHGAGRRQHAGARSCCSRLRSLVAGHVLGGPAPEDRTVLALATANRHPGVALAVASAVAAPENRGMLVGAGLPRGSWPARSWSSPTSCGARRAPRRAAAVPA
jgi:BASS family bile acid:Na+ symporter